MSPMPGFAACGLDQPPSGWTPASDLAGLAAGTGGEKPHLSLLGRLGRSNHVKGTLRRHPHPVTACGRAAASGAALDPVSAGRRSR
ncbi:hypothetical protein XACJJ10_2560014 [Xanthomonas citri pv. citri]|nr:hypothetical protein XACJJ10_2560014 [Xanthomonas citri pv. citri]